MLNTRHYIQNYFNNNKKLFCLILIIFFFFYVKRNYGDYDLSKYNNYIGPVLLGYITTVKYKKKEANPPTDSRCARGASIKCKYIYTTVCLLCYLCVKISQRVPRAAEGAHSAVHARDMIKYFTVQWFLV